MNLNGTSESEVITTVQIFYSPLFLERMIYQLFHMENFSTSLYRQKLLMRGLTCLDDDVPTIVVR